jgi:hypothetical protein
MKKKNVRTAAGKIANTARIVSAVAMMIRIASVIKNNRASTL